MSRWINSQSLKDTKAGTDFHLDIPFNLVVGCCVEENVDSLQWSVLYSSSWDKNANTCGFKCNLLKVEFFCEVSSSGLKRRNLMLPSLYMMYLSCMTESPSSSISMEFATAFSMWYSRSFLPSTKPPYWVNSLVSDWNPGFEFIECAQKGYWLKSKKKPSIMVCLSDPSVVSA